MPRSRISKKFFMPLQTTGVMVIIKIEVMIIIATKCYFQKL